MTGAKEALPVTSVSWHAAVAFTEWLSRSVQAAMPGYVARLPSESEWEWAARGGLRGMPYPLGGKPGAAVFFQQGITGPSRAGTSEPNGYGLRDMIGNVWEWCMDPFALTSNLLSSLDARANVAIERSLPSAPDHTVRGGAWENPSGTIKVYSRGAPAFRMVHALPRIQGRADPAVDRSAPAQWQNLRGSRSSRSTKKPDSITR